MPQTLLDPSTQRPAAAGAAPQALTLRRSTQRDGRRNRLELWALTHGGALWRLLQRTGSTERIVNRLLIDKAVNRAPARPYRLSTMAPYTSWDSLTDKTHNARQLPPAPGGRRSEPAAETIAALFQRGPEMIECPKSTVLFAYFAQWFTDGFLRSRRPGPGQRYRDITRNESNHEVDLTQLYGLTPQITQMLRAGEGGRLKSMFIRGEDFPTRLCDRHAQRKPAFEQLPVFGFDGLTDKQKLELFAMGSDVANVQVGYAMFNVLFLREHNRIADQLAAAYPKWDDDRLFATTRNILTVLLIKLVVEEYINHLAPYHFKFRLQPESFHDARWYRPNWESVEFNLLYRWHSMIPSTLRIAGQDVPLERTMFRNELLTSKGLGQLFEDASNQRAGKVGLFNTADWFASRTGFASIEQSRDVELASYNDYRELVGLPRVTDFDQISSSAQIREGLRDAYGSVDEIEFYVGLFAEDNRRNSALAPLMGSLVGTHAFSQLMTNPLLAPNVYVEETFSPIGWKLIGEPLTLAGLLARNQPKGSRRYAAGLTRKDWERD